MIRIVKESVDVTAGLEKDVYKRQVEQYLTKLPCPKEQKLALLKAVQDDLKNGK